VIYWARITIAKQSGLNISVNVIFIGYARLQLSETSLSLKDLYS
jgi:hypothetical protein